MHKISLPYFITSISFITAYKFFHQDQHSVEQDMLHVLQCLCLTEFRQQRQRLEEKIDY